MNTSQPVLIMAGGTGGHVFPALAVAKRLKEQGVPVHWIGTRKGLEADVVPKNDIPVHWLDVGGLRGKGLPHLFFAPFMLVRSIWQAINVVRQLKPQLVIGMGGYVTGPGGLAAWVMRKPLVVHEQNAVAGYTNRQLARFASRVMEAFPNSFGDAVKAIRVGNPVREDISALPAPEARYQNQGKPLKVLVVGGSLGARIFNEVVPHALSLLPEDQRPDVWHQTGKTTETVAKAAYQTHQVSARVEPFIEDMAAAYAWADVVLCRSGALTVAEVASSGVASILVPFPHAVDDHQTANAKFLSDNNAGKLIPQPEFTPEVLKDLFVHFQGNYDELKTMAVKAKALNDGDVVGRILDICEEVAA